MLTDTPKQLVQATFAKVVPIADVATELFYGQLFKLAPSLKPMFKGDMKEQGRKLMQMLGVAVAGLNRLEEIVPAVRALGARHVGYGVTDEHYAIVADALLWTLEQGLGADFTAEVKEAWADTYWLLANTAIEGAHAAQLADQVIAPA